MFFVIRTYSCIFVSYWWLFVSFPCKFVHHSYLFRSAVVLSMAFVVVIRENLAVQSYIFLRHSRSNRDRFFLNLIRGLLVRMDTNINSYCIRLCSWCIFVTVWTGHKWNIKNNDAKYEIFFFHKRRCVTFVTLLKIQQTKFYCIPLMTTPH